MLGYYILRTKNHIIRVMKYGKMLNKDYSKHDYDKLSSNNILIPYVFLTWKKSNPEIVIPDIIEKSIDEATRLHIVNNSHHPEFWSDDPMKATKNFTRDNPNPNGIYDATKMTDEALDEMCCDWCAMSEELDESSPKNWADKTINVRWKFTPEQIDRIYKLIDKLWKR